MTAFAGRGPSLCGPKDGEENTGERAIRRGTWGRCSLGDSTVTHTENLLTLRVSLSSSSWVPPETCYPHFKGESGARELVQGHLAREGTNGFCYHLCSQLIPMAAWLLGSRHDLCQVRSPFLRGGSRLQESEPPEGGYPVGGKPVLVGLPAKPVDCLPLPPSQSHAPVPPCQCADLKVAQESPWGLGGVST
jgi:hypothetical protein